MIVCRYLLLEEAETHDQLSRASPGSGGADQGRAHAEARVTKFVNC
jgi:hypothetical protein